MRLASEWPSFSSQSATNRDAGAGGSLESVVPLTGGPKVRIHFPPAQSLQTFGCGREVRRARGIRAGRRPVRRGGNGKGRRRAGAAARPRRRARGREEG